MAGSLWEESEVELLKVFLEMKYNHSEIAGELERSTNSIKNKVSKLGLGDSTHGRKTTIEYQNQLPEDILVIEPYKNTDTLIKHKHSCGNIWKAAPHNILKGSSCPKCFGTTRLTTEEYKAKLPSTITLLETYINSKTKILHKHNCGKEWYAIPNNILNGTGCPDCAKDGFSTNKPAVTYLIYFKELDIYKIGISNNYLKRIKHFSYKAEIIFYIQHKVGKNAKDLEAKWLHSIKDYTINTGMLTSGNTETFRF